jgi:phage protein D
MTNLRYAPEFSLTINDAPIPAALRASITSVNYQTGLEGADRVELALVNEKLRWLDHPLLALDNSLTLSIGYAPDPLHQVFVGAIVSQSTSFPSSGLPTLTVAAQDRLQRLQQGTKARWFAIPLPSGNLALPDPAVAGIVGLENGLIPIFDPVGAALAILLGGAGAITAAGDLDALQRVVRKQENESDFDFLTRVASQYGWEMFIEHTGPLGGYQLRFMSPLDRLAPEVTLKYGQSLIEFSPRITNVGQIASVTAYVWVAPLKTQFTVTIGWDWDRMALTLDIRPEFIPLGQAPSHHLIQEPVTPLSAPRRIITELIPRLNQRLTGTGSTVGDPRIRAGTVLCLAGLGVQFGGLYRVTSATHAIDSGGYRTSFEVRKEIWFGSIPLPEQGAVPVRVSSPLPV